MNAALIAVCIVGGYVAIGMLIEDKRETANESTFADSDTPTTVTTPAYVPLHYGKPSRWLENITKARRTNNRYKGRHKRSWMITSLFSQLGNVVK